MSLAGLRNLSLKQTILLIIFSSIALSTLISSLLISFNFYLDVQSSMEKSASKVGDVIKSQIERVTSLGLTLNDVGTLESELQERIKVDTDLSYVVITDMSDKVLLTTVPKLKEKQFDAKTGSSAEPDGIPSLNVNVQVLDGAKSPLYQVKVGIRKSVLNDKMQHVLYLFIIIVIVCVGGFYGLSRWIIDRRLMRPLQQLMDGTESVARGELNVEARVSKRDEVGMVTENFNAMVKEIKEIVVNLKASTVRLTSIEERTETLGGIVKDSSALQLESVDKVLDVFSDIENRLDVLRGKIDSLTQFIDMTSSTFMEMTATSSDIGGMMKNLSSGMSKLDGAYLQLNNINSKLDEGSNTLLSKVDNLRAFTMQMDSSVKSTLQTIDATSGAAEQMNQLASESKQTLQETKESISKIADVSLEVRDSFIVLKQSIDKISSILVVIEEIAEQTKMLALNAAIIAAQSDEHGRAFSIVADEIKNLSRRTQDSTKEITGLIESITEQTQGVFVKIKESATDGEEASRHAQNIDNKIGGIIEHIGLVARGVRDVVKAATEQAEGSNTLKNETEGLHMISQSLSSLREEGNSAGQNLGGTVEMIRQISEKVSTAMTEQNASLVMLNKSIADLHEFSRSLISHIEQEREEMNQARPVIAEIKETAALNSSGAAELTGNLNELKQQIESFTRITKRFIIS